MVDLKFSWPWKKEGDKANVQSDKERMVRLIIMILGPFYVVWFLFTALFYLQYYDLSGIVIGCGLVIWVAGIVILMNQRQMEAARYECFRGLTWRMSTTDRLKADVYVSSKEDIGTLGGYCVYKPKFLFPQLYKHPNLNNGEGIVFDEAYWLLPDKWKKTFFPVTDQEAWYGSLPVSVNAEDITLHNLRWICFKGKYLPVALVIDSNFHLEVTLGRIQQKEEERETEIAQYTSQIADLVKENIDVGLEMTSEAQQNQALLKNTENIEELVEQRIEDIKKRHGDIKRIPTPSRWQKINWHAIIVIVIAVAMISLIGLIVLHYW